MAITAILNGQTILIPGTYGYPGGYPPLFNKFNYVYPYVQGKWREDLVGQIIVIDLGKIYIKWNEPWNIQSQIVNPNGYWHSDELQLKIYEPNDIMKDLCSR